MRKQFKNNRIQVAILILVVILSIVRVTKEEKAYPTGDAVEYTLMTEAFYNHLSPEVKGSDYDSFKQTYTKTNEWEENGKALYYDAVGAFLKQKNLKTLDYNYAFFVDKEDRKYSAHFWFYSLLNLPARWICAVFPFNPILVFHITNCLLIIFSCVIFLKTSKYKPLETATLCVLFFYSTNYWYFCWPHPEVFTVCFTSVGLWLFFHEKKYTGILLVSIAALQNQPLAILPVVLSLIVLFNNGLNLKNISKLFFYSVWIFLPVVFYFYHYGTTNLIGYQGALSTSHITWTRIFGFFFDINQGMILALPFVLPVYLFLYVRKVFKIKTAETRWDLILFPAILIIVCGASTIDNWNHGQATVNRYVTYVGAIVLLHFVYLVFKLENKRIKYILLNGAVLTQIATVYYHQKLNKYDWSTNEPKPLSNWVLSNFPTFYNPDPTIFNSRYAGGLEMSFDESPSYFMKENGEITKFLTHRKHLDNLEKFGFSKTQIDSISPFLKYINDWAYINPGKLKLSFSNVEMKKMDDEKRITKQIETIRSTPAWFESIKTKAKQKGMDEERALREDAAFVLHISLPEATKTKEQKIAETIEQIKQNQDWLKAIQEKAEKQRISIDSALYNDALWTVEQEGK